MSARAQWFVEAAVEALDDEPDPFALPIEEVGQRIDLKDPSAALHVRLNELVAKEQNLFNADVRCEVKDRTDTSCHACPISMAHDGNAALGVLCRVGREQEMVTTELAVLACRAP